MLLSAVNLALSMSLEQVWSGIDHLATIKLFIA